MHYLEDASVSLHGINGNGNAVIGPIGKHDIRCGDCFRINPDVPIYLLDLTKTPEHIAKIRNIYVGREYSELYTSGVGVVIYKREHKIPYDDYFVLLLKRTDEHGWGVPGGAMGPYEEPLDAAIREVKEETGLNPIFMDYCIGAFRQENKADTPAINIYYAAWAIDDNIVLSSEHEDFAWVQEKDLKNYKIGLGNEYPIKKFFEKRQLKAE